MAFFGLSIEEEDVVDTTKYIAYILLYFLTMFTNVLCNYFVVILTPASCFPASSFIITISLLLYRLWNYIQLPELSPLELTNLFVLRKHTLFSTTKY
jgi:hypothetical protein